MLPLEEIKTTLQSIFRDKGQGKYADEEITQEEHALQSATLAEAESEDPDMIVAALLHDVGHILTDKEMPKENSENLDDCHEDIAYAWLREHFGPEVVDPIRLHVAAKRYLCTTEPEYMEKLSPAARKSFLDQGGPMNEEEKAVFEKEPFFKEALRLRQWDDRAKVENAATKPLEHFLNYIR